MTKPGRRPSSVRCIARYPSYEEANERQLDLLAANLDARVEYVPTGADQVFFGKNPVYALVVDDDQAARAQEIIKLVVDENHECLYRCPKCQSASVRECGLDRGFLPGDLDLAVTFGLSGLIRFWVQKRKGRRYICNDCGTTYRKKP